MNLGCSVPCAPLRDGAFGRWRIRAGSTKTRVPIALIGRHLSAKARLLTAPTFKAEDQLTTARSNLGMKRYGKARAFISSTVPVVNRSSSGQ